jgi:type IV pilus assembly PilX-like protein
MKMKPRQQKGVALIFALIFLLILSASAAALMFLAQYETWGSMNYRLMTQGRYGAEAGINSAANYLMFIYTPPGGPGDPLANYDMTKSPVQFNGADVVLSTTGNANYPSGAVSADFAAKVPGTLTEGYGTVSYTASAKLLSMRQVQVAGQIVKSTVQTWQITADGNIIAGRNAMVEVSAILEQQATPLFQYAAFATGNVCGALKFSGGAITNSYDSSALNNGQPVYMNAYGNVGSNGNLNEDGGTTIINGSMSTPRTGVGKCAAGGVDAWTDNGGATVTGGFKLLPEPVTFPTPVIPPPGTTDISGTQTLPPGNYGNIKLSGSQTLTLTPGIYNINSLSESGQSTITIGPDPVTGLYGPVILNVTGNGQSTAVDLTGGGLTNLTYDSSLLQINYAGTGTISLKGGATSAAVVYAPNGTVSFNSSNGQWLGSIIGTQIADSGGVTLSYDRHLLKKLYTLSNYMLDSFTWSKF